MRECLRMLAAALVIAVPIAVVVPLLMVLAINAFFDGLYALDPVTGRLGPEVKLTLYVLAWSASIWLISRIRRRRLGLS